MELETAYPTRNGLAISPFELELPEIETEKLTNHHGSYFRRMFGKTALHQCFRDLDIVQFQLPDNQHQWIHDNYGAVRMPTPTQMWYAIHTARERDGDKAIRQGSAMRPVYSGISKDKIDKIDRIYHKIK